MAERKDISVYIDWQVNDLPILMGVLHSEVLRGKEVFSFESTSDWLANKQFRVLDPDLANFLGKHTCRPARAILDCFSTRLPIVGDVC